MPTPIRSVLPGVSVAAVALLSLLASPTIRADSGPGASTGAFLSNGTLALDLRYRYERVEEDGFDSPAKASLLRTRITAESGEVGPLSAGLEIDDITIVGADEYNSTENGKTDYPTIADPEGTEVNQAWLRFRRQDLNATLGRQRIVLDRGRFVGAKPWRQNEQTYDGLRLQWNGGPELALDLSLVNQVNRAFGPRDGSNPADWHGESAFLRLMHETRAGHELVGFLYRLDVHGQSDFNAGKTVNNASDTIGVAYRGALAGVDFLARLASQTNTGQSQLSYRAPYYLLEMAAPLGALEVKAAYEVLGADSGVGFATPLANGHAYQGWADKFLATPGDGLRDAWLSLEGNVGPIAVMARYHDFSAESSGMDFGSEMDLQARWVINKWFTATAKAAIFNSTIADRFSDTRKAWLMLELTL